LEGQGRAGLVGARCGRPAPVHPGEGPPQGPHRGSQAHERGGAQESRGNYMKFWAGVTDTKWYRYLRDRKPEDVNFWQPSGKQQEFKVIDKGAPFLFKLKAPDNAIGGVGFFSTQAFLPISVAWDAFGDRNGCASYSELKSIIDAYRIKSGHAISQNPVIGCLILTNPIFFDHEDWISAPEDWKSAIVQGKSYDDSEVIGARIWSDVQDRLEKAKFFDKGESIPNQMQVVDGLSDSPRYREAILSKIRLGQGAFRIMVTEAYEGRCAVTGEHTLPVLEAAHIKPFSADGPNMVSNGLLLRSDLHKLFDAGYVTITPEYRFEVSTRLKEEYNNGKIYNEMNGRRLLVIPGLEHDMPRREFLSWHNENVYRAG
jgi:putative restriction endonuclease